MITTQKDLRAAFWDQYPLAIVYYPHRKRQNEYPTDTRVAWVDFVDYMARSGKISDKLAVRATL